ncbi:MAG: S8 family peptidase, partial [Bacteroidia bacterium]|nr:S8 family peptidase [Bacteroidia bacterium]
VSNAQEQVDVYGDLPTLCQSNHLITVGNSTRFDNYAGGGYSDISVDLFAPGSNIFTTAAYTSTNILLNQVYKEGFSGSSFSAPMVTAAIGIMHTYACERLLDSIKQNPAKGNLILRKLLLDGVDPINSLEGKCATGGRLNIQKALKMMDLYCQGEVGINSSEALRFVEIYPNPTEDQLYLVSSDPVLNIECIDVNGRIVVMELQNGILDCSNLAQGIYFLKVITEKGEYNLRFVKS